MVWAWRFGAWACFIAFCMWSALMFDVSAVEMTSWRFFGWVAGMVTSLLVGCYCVNRADLERYR